MPYPVVGGFLAGTGWLLFKGGIYVASRVSPLFTPLSDLLETSALQRWLPALAFGVILLIAVRVIKRPLVIPAVIVIGLVVFVDRDGRHRLLDRGGPRGRVAASDRSTR